jgi:hypothetical protein
VLNITELQNTTTNASGLSPYATLSDQIAKIQQMVIFDEKRIAVNTISAFNTTPIQVTDPMNIATLTVGGQTVSDSSANYTPSTISNWAGTAPTTTQVAIERMANLLVALNAGNPIP